MTRLTGTRNRLQQASGLEAVLDAAYEAFRDMLGAIRAHEDPATGMFAAFVMAAAAAASGRDAVAFAPSLPPHQGRNPPAGGEDQPKESAERTASDAADLSELLAARLAQAAGSASHPGDRAACDQAARWAREIHDLLAGSGS